MILSFRGSFHKDLKRIKDKVLFDKITELIEEVELADSIKSISNIKKMKGEDNAYRIRIGDYRLGIYLYGNAVEFNRILHRKEIYKYFP
ncbi:MAG: type II toxin-antitoxin system RelE/ParE family toxin [Bacteroidetes bacterium]|nr:type II toxin-antitoxin system RelE/ParE family toxin [Bacteroidota bacterium]